MLISTAVTSARVLLAVILLAAGIPKLAFGEGLSNALQTLGIKRQPLVKALRIGVPVIEVSVAVWLLSGWRPVTAALAASALLAAFTFALVRLRVRDASRCGCFLWDDDAIGVEQVVRNVLLVITAAVIGVATLVQGYTWTPVWELPRQSALVVAASVAFVALMYALIGTSLRFARDVVADS